MDKEKREEKMMADFTLKKIIKLLLIIQVTRSKEIHMVIRSTTINNYIVLQENLNTSYEPLKALLKLYGDPDDIIEKALEQIEQERARLVAEEEERQRQIEIEREKEIEKKREEELAKAKEKEMALVPIKELAGSETQLVPYHKRPNLTKKANSDILAIKKKREEREAKVYLIYIIDNTKGLQSY